eukprot:TRINITY_DN8699_c0_g1_i1.p1 TRINITY_DN8699_c0_g1~~TRINITY_DN8699_c0_g1_i1.p1  ORF type:complete len:362 (+),score=49.02 TRINITY_DN8699_c0_g1_i1:16-1101(+)
MHYDKPEFGSSSAMNPTARLNTQACNSLPTLFNGSAVPWLSNCCRRWSSSNSPRVRLRQSWQRQRSKLDLKVNSVLRNRYAQVNNGLKRYHELRAQLQPAKPQARWNKLLAGNGHETMVQAALRQHYASHLSQPRGVTLPAAPLFAPNAPIPELALDNKTLYTIPNLLTLSRMAITPLIGHAIVTGEGRLALGLFGVAAVSDWADGVIARAYPSQRSVWGSILDPLADKVLVICCASSMMLAQLIPAPVAAIWIFKDTTMIATACAMRLASLPGSGLSRLRRFFDMRQPTVEAKPLLLGKVNTFLQFSTVLLVLSLQASPLLDALVPDAFMTACWWTTSASSIATALQYIRHRRTSLVTVS